MYLWRFFPVNNQPVKGADGVTVVIEVEDQVLTHHGQSNDPNVGTSLQEKEFMSIYRIIWMEQY